MARKALPKIGLKLFGEDSQQGQSSSAKPVEQVYGQRPNTKQLFVNNGLSPLRADLATAKVVSFRKAGPTSTAAGKSLLDMH